NFAERARGREIAELRALVPFVLAPVPRETRLAHAARTRERDEALAISHELAQRFEIFAAPEEGAARRAHRHAADCTYWRVLPGKNWSAARNWFGSPCVPAPGPLYGAGFGSR